MNRLRPFFRFSCPILAILMPLVGLRADEIPSTPGDAAAADTGAIATAEQIEFFEKSVRPLLVEHCYECHSVNSERIEGGLFLDSRAAHLRGGDSGPAIIPGDVDGSPLIEAIRYESYEMPPKGKLSDPAIEVFERWVAMGAPWPPEAEPNADSSPPKFDLEQRRDEFWIWKPPTSPTVPPVRNEDWPHNPIDHFVLVKLEASSLTPARAAERSAILRRLYFDLIGLPPTPDEVEAFLAQPDGPGAIETVVDRLLQSEHFGERWGRHWLDLVRYAESRGHEFDNDTPNAWQYRDYVIRALNADVPYDQFVREHIAGDLIESPRLHPQSGVNESVLGTGFWFLGEWVHSPVDIRKDESDRFDNMLDVMSKTFLGVTVACARCHDHKFDAISTADYYSLSGFLQSSDYRQVRFESIEANRRIAARLAAADKRFTRQIRDLLDREGIRPPSQVSYPIDDGIVVDFANLPQSQFMQDGFSFGNAPRSQGTVYLSAEERGVKVATAGAAVTDPAWSGLESVSAGILENRSSVARLPKSGRTLRTPTFELKHGIVQCRVDGVGHVVACVDSHRLVAGPLHKQTVVPIKENQKWVRLNLNRYVGHRLHLEFIPSAEHRLAVRMVTQGIDGEQLSKLDQRLVASENAFQEYADRAEAILNADLDADVETQVFADFESGTYDGWTVDGDAFGAKPQTLQTIAPYQGQINGRGSFFVNSHNIRPQGSAKNADVRRGDKLTGSLTSSEFTIDFDTIEFLVGGGNHPGKTCVNLLINGKPVRTATGKADNQMSIHEWNVSEFLGETARIQVVDDHQSGWGNIGIDHIVFKKRHPRSGTDAKSQSPARRNASNAARRIISAWREERTKLAAKIIKRSHIAPAMMDGTGEDDRILIRGNSSKPGNVEPRHFLTAISGNTPMVTGGGSGRLELAEAINAPSNPLTRRVIVNRVWHHLMGRGIVPTTDDFGVLGQRPTHPELLDHLATWFSEDGQSIKRLIRYIVLSNTYQMSGHANDKARDLDPKNLLWHHRPPARLQGEPIRDSLLAISGRLNKKALGPPVPIHLTSFMDGRGRPKKSGPLDGDGRRSIYISVRRNFLSPFMMAFDTPVPFSSMGRRNVSNVPAQALILLNDPLVMELSRDWGIRATKTVPGTDEAAVTHRVNWMYLAGFARQPTGGEADAARAFLVSAAAERGVALNDPELWADFAHVLVNTKEFIFLR